MWTEKVDKAKQKIVSRKRRMRKPQLLTIGFGSFKTIFNYIFASSTPH